MARDRISSSTIGIALALVTVLFSGWLAQQALQRQVESGEQVANTHQILERVESVLANVEGAESAQRGYIITEDPAFRELFSRSLESTRSDLDLLLDLSADPAHRGAARRLDSLVNRRVAVLTEVTERHASEGFDASQRLIREGSGAELMDSVRSLAAAMISQQHSLLEERRKESAASTRLATAAVLGSTALSVLLLLGAAGMLLRDERLRLQAEAELRQALERAEEMNRGKTDFIATLSHEIRTPLNAILGMTDLLRETKLSSEQEEFTRTLHANGEGLLALIGDLLDSAKLEVGQMHIEPGPFDLRDAVEGVAEVLFVKAEAKGLDLVLSIDPRTPRMVVGDSHRLRQILMNLMGNAIKFTDRGEVAVLLEVTGTDQSAADLTLSVRDTGIGIAEEDQSSVFEKFSQSGSARLRAAGSGLGLSISRTLAEMMGGRLELQSRLGEGSIFRLSLRLPVAEAEVPSAPDLQGLRIVSMVHHPLRREVVERILRTAGAEVVSPESVSEALEQVDVAVTCYLLDDAFEQSELVAARIHERLDVEAPVVWLCSLNRGLLSELDVPLPDACVFKPIRESRLLESVATAVGSPHHETAWEPSLESSSSLGAPYRILVADDNPDNQRLLARFLSDDEYLLDFAENGVEAVALAERFRYDAILMDVEMPDIDGISATRSIRAAERQRSEPPVPIIAVTAHALDSVRERCLASGMNDFATKPIKRGTVKSLLENWVDRRPVVLMADDSPDMHIIARNYLQGDGYRLEHASDGMEAVEIFKRVRVSAVLMDMDMPRMSGFETIDALRHLPGGESVPIVAMTGYSAPETRTACFDMGCSGFLLKPVRRQELQQSLRAVLAARDRASNPDSYGAGERRTGGDSASEKPVKRHGLGRARHLLRRIERHLLRGERESALTLARTVAASPDVQGRRLRPLAKELVGSLARGDTDAAAVWNLRFSAALREAERLSDLHATGMLDSPVEDVFDRLTRQASAALGTPVTLLSLVDEDRQFFKSQHGLKEPYATMRETPLSHSFCQHVVAADRPFLVSDAREHPLVRDNLAIPDLGVIAYAGVPVRAAGGAPLGSFCAIDGKPREWSQDDIAVLEELADRAAEEIALRGRGAKRPPVAAESGTAAAPSHEEREQVPEAFAAEFLRQRSAEQHELTRMMAIGDFAAVERVGHQLKGSAATFGFPRIGLAGARIEKAAAARDLDGLRQECQTLGDMIELEISRRPSTAGR
jgi:signal transduction histidine kinase/CheY-like chemotaxis protein